MAESEEELKSLLMKVKEEGEKLSLKFNIQKTKIMASGPITSWEIDGETVETVSDFILLGSKITADGDCSHEIKRHLLLGRKVLTNLDSILKSRDITLPTKVHLVKAMVFPVVMYGCESWTVKKAECHRIDAFELWCWRRLLRVPWTATRSNQSILKEISPGCSWEGLMLKLKLQYFGHLTRRVDSLEKILMLGGIGGRRRRNGRGWDGWMASLTRWTWVWVDSGSWWCTGSPGVLQSMGSQRVRQDWVTELTDWVSKDVSLPPTDLPTLTEDSVNWVFTVSRIVQGLAGGWVVKNVPANAGDVGSVPGQEDPLENEMATHLILAWEIPWTEEPGRLQSMGSHKSWTLLTTTASVVLGSLYGLLRL